MNGEETTNKLHEIDVDVCVIDSSGYANNPVMSDCITYGFKAVVKKASADEGINLSRR